MRTIDVHVPYEDIISRIPGLFAIAEQDKVLATVYPDGCYGKIVADIKLNCELNVNNHVILENGGVYTYKTIMRNYYQYKDSLEKTNDFISFVERGIGKVPIKLDKAPLAPEYIYISQSESWLKKLELLHKQCSHYKKLVESGGNDEHLCCLCDYYKDLGGDRLLGIVKKLIQERDVIAQEYFGYAVDTTHIELNLDLESTHKDLGVTTPNVELWSPYKIYKKGDEVFYDNKFYVANVQEASGKWNDDLEVNEFLISEWKHSSPLFKIPTNEVDHGINKEEVITAYQIEGRTDSKLKDIQRTVTYVNEYDKPEKPRRDKDWLFYYRVGIVRNITANTDDAGNIVTIDGKTAGSSDKDNLLVYGDVITEITTDDTTKEITFIYVLGIQLTATYKGSIVKNGKTLHQWADFTPNVDSKTGIKYTETYHYFEGSDLDDLVKGRFGNNISFDEYINGDFDNALDIYKFEFDTSSAKSTYEQKIYNKSFTSTVNMSDFILYRNNWNDFGNSGIIRLDYLTGITYAPAKEINVRIQRGSTSAFEQHIAFGEIKTFEDLENHSGDYFKLTVG